MSFGLTQKECKFPAVMFLVNDCFSVRRSSVRELTAACKCPWTLAQRNLVECINISCFCLVAQSCLSLCDPKDCSSPGSWSPWDFPGKNTGVGCYFLLQGIFLTRGWNSCLLHWQVDSLLLKYPGKPVTSLSMGLILIPPGLWLGSGQQDTRLRSLIHCML